METNRLFDLPERCLTLFPDSDVFAAKCDGKWIKYTPLDYFNFTRWFALGLLEMGFKKGDKIASVTNNRP
jgi:long-chain acyl-CoA synthetase